MLRVGVQFCTMLSSAASTSCLMKALDSPALCSRTLAVASSSWSIPFCRPEYISPKVTTAMRDTPERRFRTCTTESVNKNWTAQLCKYQYNLDTINTRFNHTEAVLCAYEHIFSLQNTNYLLEN